MPEYKQGGIAVELEQRIKSGIYRGKLPPLNSLAEEFQVNIRTMTKSLSLLTKKGLVAKKRGIGAFVNGSKATQPNILVNYFYAQGQIHESSYHAAIWDGIRAGAQAGGCTLNLTKEFEGDMAEYDGVIFIGHGSDTDYDVLLKDKQPFIVIEQLPHPEICSVSADVHGALYQTIYRMIKSGLRQVAYIGMTTSRRLFTDVAKFHAWLEANDDALQMVNFDLVRHVWPLPENSYAATCDILKHAIPDAIFVTSDLMAAGVYKALAEHNLRVPEDVGVLGCDGLDIGLEPKLATISVPRFEMGRSCITMLLDMIREPGRRRPPKVLLPTTFRPGASLRFDDSTPNPSFIPHQYTGFVPPVTDDYPSRKKR